MKAYLNGRILDEGGDRGVGVSLRDRGLLYGDGVFETMRVRNGRIEFLREHVARLMESALELGIPLDRDHESLRESVQETMEANGGGDLVLRMTVTRGAGGTRLDPEGCDQATLFITAAPFPPKGKQTGVDGLRLVTSPFPVNESSPLCKHKTTNRLESILARSLARGAGADDAIFRNTKGRWAEATAANLFLIRNATLVTPAVEEGVLPGIIRRKVLDAAPSLPLQVEERGVAHEEAFLAEEIFLTNSLLGIASVAALDGRPFPSLKGNAYIHRLRARVEELAVQS